MNSPTGYEVRTQTVQACGADFEIESLLNLQQFADPLGEAALAGISEETWPLFGMVWPSARVLAHAMVSYTLSGQRILEVGCGLALASLVLHRRQGNVTASDCHPLVPHFLTRNLALNSMSGLPYQMANWARPHGSLGRFDLIIGSDVLYERGHAGQLSSFLDAHTEAHATVVLVDPNRSQRVTFSRDMEGYGFGLQWAQVDEAPGLTDRYRGRMLTYSR